MKPALFNVLCEIKEKTGRTFKCFRWPVGSLPRQSGAHYLNIKIAEGEFSQDRPRVPTWGPGGLFPVREAPSFSDSY